MTRKQQEFYRMIANQIFDYNEDFHKEFTIKRIEQIPDDKLQYLLEDITVDKDNIVKKKGFLSYAKFVYYADKMIEVNVTMLANDDKVEQLYSKRELLLHTIENQTSTITQRNELIANLESKKLMFKDDNGKNLLDNIDYYIIEKFGFYNFFDENKNYMVKEQIKDYFEQYHKEQYLLQQRDSAKLIGI
jgi:hypothetical protein